MFDLLKANELFTRTKPKIKTLIDKYTVSEKKLIREVILKLGCATAVADNYIHEQEIVFLNKILKLFGNNFQIDINDLQKKYPIKSLKKDIANLPTTIDRNIFLEIIQIIAECDGVFLEVERAFLEKFRNILPCDSFEQLGVKSYLNKLEDKARKYIKDHNIGDLDFSNFKRANLFLLSQALEKDCNLFIQTLEKEDKKEVYIPAILSLMISLFVKVKNVLGEEIKFKVGDIVEYKKEKWKIIEILDDGKFKLKGKKDYSLIVPSSKFTLLSSMKVSSSKKNEQFQNLFKKIFPKYSLQACPNLQACPKKIALILEKKEFQEELTEYSKDKEIDFKKAIPYRWVTSKGKFEEPSNSFDTMFLLAPNYGTCREYILDKYSDDIEAVVFIGKNKYSEDYTLLKDLRESKIKSSIIIGSEPLPKEDSRFFKWRWTSPELLFLINNKIVKPTFTTIEQSKFEEAVERLKLYWKETEENYNITLPSLSYFERDLYSKVFPSVESPLKAGLEESKMKMKVILKGKLEDQLYDSDREEFLDEEIEKLEQNITDIFNKFSNEKLQLLEENRGDKTLVVPQQDIGYWTRETKYNVIGFNKFKKLEKDDSKDYIFFSLFGYTWKLKDYEELIDVINQKNCSVHFVFYKTEQKFYEALIHQDKKELEKEYNSEDREKISNIEFPKSIQTLEEQNENESQESIDELINRFTSEDNEEVINHVLKLESKKYRLSFEQEVKDNQLFSIEDKVKPLDLEGNKSVLLIEDTRKSKIRVRDVKIGNKIICYDNISKDKLYEIAKQEPSFDDIEKASLEWVKKLNDFFENKKRSNFNYTEEDLLCSLQAKGIHITILSTLNNWLAGETKFPEKKDLKIICELSGKQLDFNKIKKHKSNFQSIMIALGRDLSDEVMDYIKSKKRGAILDLCFKNDEEIKAFIKKVAPPKVVISKKLLEDE